MASRHVDCVAACPLARLVQWQAALLMKTRGQKTTNVKRRRGPLAARRSSTSHLRKQLEQRDRELAEALQQQAATANVLKVINRSTFDLGSVLETIIENATSLGGAEQGFVYRSDGEVCM